MKLNTPTPEQNALLKALDILILAAQALQMFRTDRHVDGFFRSTTPDPQNTSASAYASPQAGTTFTKKNKVVMDSGETRTLTETYELGEDGQWYVIDLEVEEVAHAQA